MIKNLAFSFNQFSLGSAFKTVAKAALNETKSAVKDIASKLGFKKGGTVKAKKKSNGKDCSLDKKRR